MRLADKPVIGFVVKRAIAFLASNQAGEISNHFSKFPRPELADSEKLKNEVFQLRHSVYCEELRFEDSRDNCQVTDEFDARSIHCFVRHLSSNSIAGTVRLITSSSTAELLQVEQFCSHAFWNSPVLPAYFKR